MATPPIIRHEGRQGHSPEQQCLYPENATDTSRDEETTRLVYSIPSLHLASLGLCRYSRNGMWWPLDGRAESGQTGRHYQRRPAGSIDCRRSAQGQLDLVGKCRRCGQSLPSELSLVDIHNCGVGRCRAHHFAPIRRR